MADAEPYEIIGHSKNREDWLSKRRIGGSDAATIGDTNPWSSKMHLYATLIGTEETASAGEAAEWGLRLEPIVAGHFGHVTGRQVKMAGELLLSTQYPWATCTLDATQVNLEGDEGLLEVKCTSLYERWEDGVPPYVFAQVQHQFAVSGYSWGSVAVLFRGQSFHWLDIYRNDEFITELMAAESTFWDRVQKLAPPEPDDSDPCRKALARLYPKDDGGSISLSGEFTAMDEERSQIAATMTDLEKQKRLIDNRIKMAIGDHSEAVIPSGTVYTYKANKRGVRSLKRKEIKL